MKAKKKKIAYVIPKQEREKVDVIPLNAATSSALNQLWLVYWDETETLIVSPKLHITDIRLPAVIALQFPKG